MDKLVAQADLSGWLSPDEERLLNLYRRASQAQRQQHLFRLCRQRYLPWITAEYDERQDALDTSYLEQELEDQLLLVAPWPMLGEFYGDEPHRLELLATAWGRVGPVILGISEQDGLRADQLFNSAIRLWDALGAAPGRRAPLRVDRRDALAFIEAWREAVIEQLFCCEEGSQ
ncbi:hypothetical protein B382_22470 [Stutzerimonas stutzeri B1SMN1]|nr:hypothetical protein B382_22470 [Stutzerimonas stutzeri B1SMN1]